MIDAHKNTDSKTLAYINMYAIFGALENLCELDPKARALLTNKKPITIGFFVKDGPNCTLTFKNGRCRLEDGVGPCDICLPFSSCEKFNGMIDGTATPIPTKGFLKLKFLLKDFMALTDHLTKYLRPSEEDLKDEEFFNLSTKLLFYVIAVALAQIGNHDKIGRFSASQTVDGDVLMSIGNGGPKATIHVKDHRFLTIKKAPDEPRAMMEFCDMKLANDLFNGKVNSLACVGSGEIKMGGMMSMVDNINRILDRVALYLA